MQMNLAQQPSNDNSDFLIGDVVVFIDDFMHGELMTISSVSKDSVLMDSNAKFALSHLVRHASVTELNAKKRLEGEA